MQIVRAAISAHRRCAGVSATVVTLETPGGTVKDHACTASFALRHPSAAAANQRRGKTAAVDKHHRLFAALDGLVDSADQRLRNAVRCLFGVKVDEADGRQGRLRNCAFAQHQSREAAAFDVVERFNRRRRRTQHHRTLGDTGAEHCHVARRIAHALLLLEGRVVFFVDDDQTESRHRCEDRESCADDDVSFAVLRAAPRRVACATRHAAVGGRDLVRREA